MRSAVTWHKGLCWNCKGAYDARHAAQSTDARSSWQVLKNAATHSYVIRKSSEVDWPRLIFWTIIGIPLHNTKAHEPVSVGRRYPLPHLTIHLKRCADFDSYGMRGTIRTFCFYWVYWEVHAPSLCPPRPIVMQKCTSTPQHAGRG